MGQGDAARRGAGPGPLSIQRAVGTGPAVSAQPDLATVCMRSMGVNRNLLHSAHVIQMPTWSLFGRLPPSSDNCDLLYLLRGFRRIGIA